MKVMSLLEKVEMLDTLNRGMRIAAVTYHYDVKRSTACFIKRNESKIKGKCEGQWSTGSKKFFVQVIVTPSLKRWKTYVSEDEALKGFPW
jgi:hypothetical protein